MTRTLYAYVDAADLEDVAETIEHRLSAFIESRVWIAQPDLVNQRHPPDPADRDDDLPLWDLRVNFPIPEDPHECDWFRDVVALVHELALLRTEIGRDFVIGVHESDTGVAEDLFFVDSDTPSIQDLREIMGVPEAAV